MTFNPIFKAASSPIQNQYRRSKAVTTSIFFRDAVPLSTLLAIGGTLSGLSVLLLGRIALLIPVAVVLVKLANTLLIITGAKTNPYMQNVIPSKVSAQLPNADGTFGPKPASESVTIFLLGSRSNHPLGILAPGMKELGKHMSGMQRDIDARAAEYGLINSSLWLGAERAAGNEIVYIMYFKNIDGLHKYAHDELHRNAWNWWNATYKEHPYISIWHEAFVSPAGMWETIYGNSHPTLLGGGSVGIKTESGTQYTSTLVDANKGALRSSRGRMARTDGADNEKYGLEPYDVERAEMDL